MTPAAQVPEPSREVLERWGVVPAEYLGGHANDQWLVESGGGRLVLRGYRVEPLGDIDYELDVSRRLRGLGWPVPVAVAGPVQCEGRSWCLLDWLPGASRQVRDGAEKRARGRLLAELHDSMVLLAGMGQRNGFALLDEVIRDPKLVPLIQDYERIYPGEARIMRWHLDAALQRFEQIDLKAAERIVLHSDFAPWNLLFEGEKLTGILDFESTHLNYRVGDFALSWRGYQDEVIDGYQEVHKLTDLDWELLIPAYWSWLFLGVKDELKAMISGEKPPHRFEWQVKHLMTRSGLLGQRVAEYPG